MSIPTHLELSLAASPLPPVVELRGEIDDWLDGRFLSPQPADTDRVVFRCDLELPPGVYAYKYRVDGQWMLDPSNPRTRCKTGDANNVLVVGGTPEPLLFAPGLPFLSHHPRGGVVVTALLRKGHGRSVRVTWSEGRPDTDTVTPMVLAGEEREHLIFMLHLPTSTSNAAFRFLLEDGSIVGQSPGFAPFTCPPAPTPLPAWWRDGVVYTVLLDRFRPAQDRPDWTDDPGPDLPAGGHLDGLTRSLDSLAELGIKILHITPVHRAVGCHRYDVSDPTGVDPALGGEPAFRRLLESTHERNMRVLLDFSFVHVGRGFAAYEDVRQHGTDSRFASWFLWKPKEGKQVLRQYGGRRDAPLLNLENPEVQDVVLRSAAYWAKLGIDGFRLDAAAQFPLTLGKRIRDTLREHVPSGIVFGEVVPQHAWRWHESGVVDAATDFSFHRIFTSFVAERSIDAGQAADRLAPARRMEALPDARSVRFLSTHDHNRFATLSSVRGDPSRTALGLLMLAAAPGVPMLVYGEELGLAAEVASLRPEGVWEDRAPMPWVWSEQQAAFRALTKSLLEARQAHPALRVGDLQVMFAEDRLIVARRRCGEDVVDIAINASDVPVELDLDDDWLELLDPIATVGEVRTRHQSVALGPNAGLLAKRRRRARRPDVEDPRARMQRQVRDEAFAAGAPQTPTRPTRIDFALTERCNLRCRHCINHSPERTCQRSARTLSLAVLDQLREDLSHASYFGFVHGGESLTAPILVDVLDAIRFARAGASTTIHLLTNGMLLTPHNTVRLFDAGVRSLSVSIDGATPQTNDSIRIGSKLDKVVEHVRGAVALRAERRADVRIGISCVVTRENLHELKAMAELAADVGVDWLKLEELVPSTDEARNMMIDVQTPEVRDAIEASMAWGTQHGLVMVDHTNPPRVWRCRLQESPEMASFLNADQFANRSEIHPCRTPWELACIEPNGDVHIASFHGPVLGNVMAEPLSVMWNGAVASSERVRSRIERLCGGGPVTCLK